MDRIKSITQSAIRYVRSSEDATNYIIVAIALILFTFLVCIIVYVVRSIQSAGSQAASLVTSPIALDNTKTLPVIVKSAVMPLVTRGSEFSLNFWLYLTDAYEATKDHKLVLQRGNGSALPSSYDYNANPLVFLDKSTNRLYVAVSTSNVLRNDMGLSDILQMDPTNQYYINGHVVAYIDYIPLQRWVQIAIVIQDSSLILFLDGDLYTIANVGDPKFASPGGARPIIRGSAGDLGIGDSKNSVKGFLTKLNFYNYALSASDMVSGYASGPGASTILGAIGLPAYGLRTPIYPL